MSEFYEKIIGKRLGAFLALICTLGFASTVCADQFHYNNTSIGDRAMGMGGAYGGVSDDSSGVYYNPAGLAFAQSNDISGSANAFYSREVTYKKTIGAADFLENSGGSFPSFFGGLQKLNHISKDLVFAFGMFTVDSELKDQNDLIENKTLTAANGSSVDIQRFHRTVNQRASTFYAGAGVGKLISRNWSLGFAINYLQIDELVQEFQDVRQTRPDSSGSTLIQTLSQNIRQNLAADGLQVVLGTQYTKGRFTAGLTHKMGKYVTQKMTIGTEQRFLIMTEDIADTLIKDTQVTGGMTAVFRQSEVEAKEPLGSTLPTETRLGLAWFYSTRALFTLDVISHGAVTGGKIGDYPEPLFSKQAIMDYALGVEYFVLPSIPVRLGLFTNNDVRPEIEAGKSGQQDHLDYMGESVFLAWVQPNSQIAAGVILQQGSGKAQKLGDETIQKVEASSQTFAFSATHSF